MSESSQFISPLVPHGLLLKPESCKKIERRLYPLGVLVFPLDAGGGGGGGGGGGAPVVAIDSLVCSLRVSGRPCQPLTNLRPILFCGVNKLPILDCERESKQQSSPPQQCVGSFELGLWLSHLVLRQKNINK